MEMRPNPQCSNNACIERQVSSFKVLAHFNLENIFYLIDYASWIIAEETYNVQKEYLQTKPARDAAAKAKLEAESSKNEGPLHMDNEWNIRCLNFKLRLAYWFNCIIQIDYDVGMR